jgi:hypothetical protein
MSGIRIPISVFLALLLCSCSAATNNVGVASFPSLTPIAKYPPNLILSHTYLEIVVMDVERSAERATQLTTIYNGYLISANSRYSLGQKIVTLSLAVPTDNFENLHSDLKSLGQVINESLSE